MSDRVARPENSTTVRANTGVSRLVRGYFAALQAVAPALAEREATRIFFTPQRRRGAAPGPLAGESPRHFRVRTGRARMHCWSYGRGPQVVFVHGWGGSAGDWRAMAEAVLRAGYGVVLCDFPAHGRSSGRQTTLPEMSRALHALADELAFTARGRFEPLQAVVAHSFGGAATALALRDGLLAHSVVLVAPVAHPMAFVDSVAEALGLSEPRRAGMRERIRVRAGGDLRRVEAVDAIREAAVRGLVVHDRDDAAVPFSDGRDLAGAWHGAELLATRGLGHRGVLRDAAVIRRVVDFIAEPRPARAHEWPALAAVVGF